MAANLSLIGPKFNTKNANIRDPLIQLDVVNGENGGDFNNYTITGYRAFYGGPTHGPSDSEINKAYGLLKVYRTDPGYVFQECYWVTSGSHFSWRISTDFGASWRNWIDEY